MIVLTCVALATLDQRGSGIIDSTRRIVRDVIAPVQDLADRAIEPGVDFFDDLGRADSLAQENQQLRRRMAAVRGALADAKVANARNQELEQLLALPTPAGWEAVNARVVAGSVGSFERTFRIDRGTSEGVQVGDAVAVGGESGVLVGQVIAVSQGNATVRRIDDRRHHVGVILVQGGQGPGARGIAEGQEDSALLRLSFLPAGTEPKKGQPVVTLGLATEPYPPGLVVGVVERVSSGGVPGAHDALVRPATDLDRLDAVKVLRRAGAPK